MTESERSILRELQQDMPVISRPFRVLARRAGVTEEEFIAGVQSLRARGIIREVNAVLRHRQIGYHANALCVWKVGEERVEEVGYLYAGLTYVTHCYERETQADWPYNLYTMVHAATRDACEKQIAEMSRLGQNDDYLVFYSTHELKKTTMRYF